MSASAAQIRRLHHAIPNPVLLREVNEQIHGATIGWPAESAPIEIVCECGHACQEHVMISRALYESVRQHSTRFVIKPGHSIPAYEQIVERHDDFAIVEATAQHAVAAVQLDPRNRTRLNRSAA
jgi:hypothetical protein